MSANDGAASSSNVAAEGNFEPSANNEAASSSNVDIIINSDQDAIMEMEAAAEAELQATSMDSVPSANNEVASSSNGDIITISDQNAIMKKEAAAEGTHVDSQLDIMAAIIEGKIDPFNKIAREFVSIVTPSKNTILHINIMCRNRSSMETASTKFVEDILHRCPSLLRQVNDNAETPLHVAAKYGHSDMVDVLIKSSAKAQNEDPESGTTKEMLRMTNNEGNTALHEAVKYNHLDVVKILTKEDHDFTYASNNRGETPLYIAAAAAAVTATAAAAAASDILDFVEADMKNPLQIVVEILETCTKPAYEGPYQMTALHAVAMINYLPGITRKILEKNKSLIKEKDQYGWTPLHYAAYHQNRESMEALLECDVSTTYIGDKDRKMTPLHIAIGRGYIPDEIISHCPDCCVLVDERRWNVLHFAMLSLTYNRGLKNLLKEYPLIRNLINEKDVDGNTPLHFLATFRPRLLLWIIKHEDKDIKLDLSVVNNQNMSVLELMMEFGSRQMIKQEILKLVEPAGPYKYGVVSVIEGAGGYKEEDKNKFENAKESRLIVAALIATVTFTTAFTLPGGVIQEGDKEGTAILSKKAAFQAFVITDAIAMVLSLSAVFAHFLMSTGFVRRERERGKSTFLLIYGGLSTVMAMGAMVIAFVTGTYAVLTTSLWLAILTTFIGFSFFLLMFLICCGMVWFGELYEP